RGPQDDGGRAEPVDRHGERLGGHGRAEHPCGQAEFTEGRVESLQRKGVLLAGHTGEDDGAERDPRFVDMVRELRLPVSMFLTDSVVGPGYGHFARLRAVGATVQNHTLDHTALRGLPYAGQRAEICGQQNKLKQRFGVRPTLFRPPYGVYDTTTLRAAADCGLSALVLWRASMQIHDLRYAVGDRLRPGDIVLAGFRGPDQLKGTTLTEMTTRLLRRVQEQGLTVGRLEDYL
ncbi:polysaccharide deacetylase family protein, partial [Streptomyces caniscabiei]|uniref:polysaccharide deacetylase family protein n=1 Tax=Streptomyces caniscabiei TaxID=2746961 RepID=UPI003B9828E7